MLRQEMIYNEFLKKERTNPLFYNRGDIVANYKKDDIELVLVNDNPCSGYRLNNGTVLTSNELSNTYNDCTIGLLLENNRPSFINEFTIKIFENDIEILPLEEDFMNVTKFRNLDEDYFKYIGKLIEEARV